MIISTANSMIMLFLLELLVCTGLIHLMKLFFLTTLNIIDKCGTIPGDVFTYFSYAIVLIMQMSKVTAKLHSHLAVEISVRCSESV